MYLDRPYIRTVLSIVVEKQFKTFSCCAFYELKLLKQIKHVMLLICLHERLSLVAHFLLPFLLRCLYHPKVRQPAESPGENVGRIPQPAERDPRVELVVRRWRQKNFTLLDAHQRQQIRFILRTLQTGESSYKLNLPASLCPRIDSLDLHQFQK